MAWATGRIRAVRSRPRDGAAASAGDGDETALLDWAPLHRRRLRPAATAATLRLGARPMPDPFFWSQILPYLAAAFAFGYLLGSIPFGLVLTRLAGAGDIRQIGSGNIGATNVLRTGRKGLALATLLLDGAKGAAALLLIHRLYGEEMAL